MKFIISTIVFLTSLNVFARDMSVQGLLGLDRSAINIGVDVDFKMRETHSVGGYLIVATEKENVRPGQLWSVGADVKVFFGPDAYKLYLAPGVGMASFEVGGQSEMTLGTILKVGTLFEVAYDMYLGLELMMYNNWFSDDAPEGFQLANAVFRVDF